jgi:hypothetical protein
MKKLLLLLLFACFLISGMKAQCPPPPTPSICMVTCDGASVNNIIYWDKTGFTHVDSIIIYREVASAVYRQIGAVPGDSLSEFIDTTRSVGPANGDPNTASYRYKIQIRDSCGVFSAMSPYHNTIYIIDVGAGEFDWSIPYSIEGSGSPVTNYILICDTLNVDVWTAVNVVSTSASAAIDPGFVAHSSIANWRVKTAWSISCTPTRASINTTRSNIKHAASVTTGILSAPLSDVTVAVYPNPANGMVTIQITTLVSQGSIQIINMLGERIYSEALNSKSGTVTRQVDVSAYAKGVYTVCIENSGTKVFRKLVVN